MVGKWTPVALALVTLAAQACGSSRHHAPEVRYVAASEAKPRGEAPHAEIRLVTTEADGTRNFVVVLGEGDEVATALSNFAREQKVVNARLQGIGAVRDPEVGWFDLERKQYKAMTFREQLEMLSLSGDIVLGPDGAPVVHLHALLGTSGGRALGGHLLHAITSPTLEVYVTAYPDPVHKRAAPEKGVDLIDLSKH